MTRIFTTLLLFIASLLTGLSTSAQFQIGHTTITFNDPDRTGGFGEGGGPGRQIQTEIYYPADVAGNNVAVAGGSFPVVSFGHGFVMEWSSYANIWELLATNGYIVAFPRTEGDLSPSHLDFGLDLALVIERMQDEGADETSLFFNHVASSSALMGHSMGGGAAVIAASTINVQALLGLASAETNFSAIGAAENVEAPLLMFAGSSDDVTPPAEHQIPIYNAAASSCKYLVNITGGGHCQFANSSGTCEFGELFTSGNISITRAQQHATMNDYIVPWLNRWLKEDTGALQEFVDLVWVDDRITFVENCVVLSVDNKRNEDWHIFPNPVSDQLYISGGESKHFQVIRFFNNSGQLVLQKELNGANTVDVQNLSPGMYNVIIEQDNGQLNHTKLIKE